MLALDRAFDRDPLVLLQSYAGSGKTTTAAEFARWYQKTGGVDGPVLFTSFDRYLPLPSLLDTFAQVFETELQQAGVHWLTLDDAGGRHGALGLQDPGLGRGWMEDTRLMGPPDPATIPAAFSQPPSRMALLLASSNGMSVCRANRCLGTTSPQAFAPLRRRAPAKRYPKPLR